MFVADKGYFNNFNYAMTPTYHNQVIHGKTAVIRAHQTINGIHKVFNCLSDMFCHDVKKNGIVFGAVVNIMNLKIRLGGNLNVELSG